MVAAPSCVIADALTKVAALAGPACGPLLARFGAQALWDTDPAHLEAGWFRRGEGVRRNGAQTG